MQKYDPSQVSISFLYTLKTSENQRFLIFSGDRERNIGLKKNLSTSKNYSLQIVAWKQQSLKYILS